MTNERRRSEDKELIKDAVKEAVKEWLQDVYATFGRWSLRAVGAALVVALLYLILTLNGWSHTPNVTHAVEIRK